MIDREALIGEVPVVDAPALAERMFAEAQRAWSSPGWKSHTSSQARVQVESKPVTGPFLSRGLVLVRARAQFEVDAQTLFEFMVSPAGFQVIDPFTDPADHEAPPAKRYAWAPRGSERARLELAHALSSPPFATPREFVVLNAIDPRRRMFASKSVQHPMFPGASVCTPGVARPEQRIRALNTFALSAEPEAAAPAGTCHLRLLNYVDFGGRTPRWLLNAVNVHAYFGPLCKRIDRAIAQQLRSLPLAA